MLTFPRFAASFEPQYVDWLECHFCFDRKGGHVLRISRGFVALIEYERSRDFSLRPEWQRVRFLAIFGTRAKASWEKCEKRYSDMVPAVDLAALGFSGNR